MITKIDWLSFSVKAGVTEDIFNGGAGEQITRFLDKEFGYDNIAPILQGDFAVGEGRKPYKHSYRRRDGGIAIFFHPLLNHFLVEVSGRACDELFATDAGNVLLAAVQHRLTRLDVACDMLTDAQPGDFADQRDKGRFKSGGHLDSESGHTWYVGSRDSNRYARVYRYNPPHERAHLLRCEHVVKGQDAKRTAKSILEKGVNSTAKALGNAFKWEHPAWQPDAQDAAELKAWRPERREGKTMFWLADTVAPLLLRLHNEGTLDIHQWLDDHVYAQLNDYLKPKGGYDPQKMDFSDIPF